MAIVFMTWTIHSPAIWGCRKIPGLWSPGSSTLSSIGSNIRSCMEHGFFFPQIFVLDRTFLTLFEISWDYTWSAKAKGILTRSWQESAGISIVSPDRISLVWIKGRNINILRIWTNKCWRPRNKNGDSPVCAKHVVYFKRGKQPVICQTGVNNQEP